jgi:hypothetical protein
VGTQVSKNRKRRSLGRDCKSRLGTEKHINTGPISRKTKKELTVGFHGKSTDATCEVVDEFVRFLEAAFSMHCAEGKITKNGRTPTKVHHGDPTVLGEASNVQPALKHSCPQKNEPEIPSLRAMRMRSRRSEKRTDFAQVGHSNLDGGFPLMQFELWHLIAVSTMLVDVRMKGKE